VKKFLTFLALILFIFIDGYSAFSDPFPLKSAGKTIQPLNDVPVQMVSEEVEIRLGAVSAQVECLFFLKNLGKQGKIRVGFPLERDGELINFIAKDDKSPYPYPIESTPQAKIFTVTFDSAGEALSLENRYSTILQPQLPREEIPLSNLLFTYVLKTGASWKGPIKKAKISVGLVYVPFDQIVTISPKGYVYDDKIVPHITWNFQNFEPTQDIEITILPDLLYERLVIAKNILNANPDNGYAHFLLGTVLYNRDFLKDTKNSSAEKEFLKALSLDSKLIDARWYLAAIYRHSLKANEANVQLETIIRENPNYRCEDKLFRVDRVVGWSSPKRMLNGFQR
jgi:hypothetical protein